MKVLNLCCAHDHRFEGWFGSSAAYADQRARGLVTCPQCGSAEINKAPMAPAVPAKGNARAETVAQSVTGKLPPELAKAVQALATAQADALKNSTWVGERFVDESRAMHYGERDHTTIHGQATPEQAIALAEEGITVSPLPFPVARPDEVN